MAWCTLGLNQTIHPDIWIYLSILPYAPYSRADPSSAGLLVATLKKRIVRVLGRTRFYQLYNQLQYNPLRKKGDDQYLVSSPTSSRTYSLPRTFKQTKLPRAALNCLINKIFQSRIRLLCIGKPFVIYRFHHHRVLDFVQ